MRYPRRWRQARWWRRARKCSRKNSAMDSAMAKAPAARAKLHRALNSSLVEPVAREPRGSTVSKLPTCSPAVKQEIGRITEGTCRPGPIVRHRRMHTCRTCALIFCLLAGLVASLTAQEKSDAATVRALELKWTESYKQHS